MGNAALNTVWQFATSPTLKFGRGARHQIWENLSRLGLNKPLIVTDRNLAEVRLVREYLAEFASRGCTATVFADCVAEPAIDVAELAIAAGQQSEVDCVIGIGGGSNLDVAKIVATVLRHGGGPAHYFGFNQVPGAVLPVFALPTTAGTGSEVSHSAVLTDTAAQIKVSTLSPWLRPSVAIVDPELTDSCPRQVTAHSGIDALVHAIEAFTNKPFADMHREEPPTQAYEGSYPLTRLLAAEAIRLVSKSLVVACDEGGNTQARDDMALAATLAGMAFSNSGVGIVHALEYPIGALTHVGHGEGNGLLLPHVMRFNQQACEDSFAQIAELMCVDTRQMTSAEAARAAVDAVVILQQRVGIRTRLRDLGMGESSIVELATKTFEIKRLMSLNVRPPTLGDLIAILKAAY